MAADGNININAEITPKVNLRELQSETDKLGKSLNNLAKNTKGIPGLDKTREQAVQTSRQIEQLQRNLDKALNQRVVNPDYIQLTKQISETEKELAKAEKQVQAIKTAAEKATTTADKQLIALAKQVEAADANVDKLAQDWQKAMNGQTKPIQAMTKQAEEADAKVAKLQQELQKALTVKSKSDAFVQLEKDLAGWEKKMETAGARIEKMRELGTDTKKNGEQTAAFKSAEYDYKHAAEEIGRIKDQMQQLKDAGADIKIGDSKAAAQLQQKLDEATKKSEEIHANLDKVSSEQVSKYYQKLTEADQKSRELHNNLAQAQIDKGETVQEFNKELTTAQTTADTTEEKLRKLNVEKREWERGNRGKFMEPKDSLAVDTYSRALAVAKQNAQTLEKRLQHIRTVNKIFNGLAAAAKAAAKAISKIVSAARTVRSALQKIGSSASKAFNSMRKSSDKSHKHMMRNIIQYVLGFRSLFFLIRRLRKTIVDDFGAMAKSIPEFNTTMSELYNTFNQLKGSLGTAIQPIVTAVTPALLEIMNIAIDAANAVGTFFATLTGQGVIYKAVKGNVDYAASLDKSTKSTKKQSKAQKDLNEKLGEYDKLSVIKQETKSTKSSSKPTDDDNELKYEAVPIDKDSDISKFAAKLKAAWKKQDWKGLGKIMGTTINDLVNKIKEKLAWKNVGPKIKKWVHNIGTAFNSLVSTVDWKNIGETIGEGVNTITNTINTALSEFNIPALGTALSDTVNGAIDTINWKSMGDTAGKGLNTITRTINNFIDNTKWRTLGSNLSDAFTNFIESVDPKSLGKALSSPIKALTNTFSGFLTNFTSRDGFGKLGTKIGETVNAWFSNINWKTIKQNIRLGINGIIRTFRKFFTTTDWTAIGADLAEIINGIFAIDWGEAGSLISDIAGSLLDTITSLLDNVNWEDIGSAVIKLISGIKWSDVISKYYKAFGSLITALVDVITGLLEESPKLIDVAFDMIKGIISGISSINWGKLASSLMKAMGALVGALFAVKIKVATHIIKFVKSIITGIGTWFKRKKAECAKNGENIVWGILKGIWNAMKNIAKWLLDHVFKPFIAGFKKAFGIASPSKKMKKMGGYLIDGLKAGLSGIWKKIKKKFTDMWDSLKKWWDGLKFAAKEAAANFVDNVTEAWNSVKEWWDGIIVAAKEAAANFIDNVTEAWNKLKEWWDKLKDGVKDFTANLKETATKGWEAAKTFVTDKWEKLKDGAKDFTTNFKETATENWEFAKDFLSTTWDKLKTGSKDFTTNLKETATSKWEEAKSFLADTWDTLSGSTKDFITNLKETTTSKWESAKTFLTNTWDTLSSSTKEWWMNLKNDISAEWDTTKTWISSKWSGFKSDTKSWLMNLKTSISSKWDTVKEEASTKWKTFKSGTKSWLMSLKTSISSKWDTVKTWISSKWSGFKSDTKSWLMSLKTSISKKWDTVKTEVSTNWSKLKQGTKEWWVKLKGTIGKKFNEVTKWLGTNWDKLKGDTKEWVVKLKDGVTKAWTNLKKKWKKWKAGSKEFKATFSETVTHFFRKMVIDLVNAVNGIIKKINDTFGTHLGYIPPSEWMYIKKDNTTAWISYGGSYYKYYGAQGGIIDKPTTLLAGEDGPEMLVPLKKHTEWLGTMSKLVASRLALDGVEIPKLATGQVIPPNKEFVALLGDQSSGVNIESPLSTIEEALANVFDRYLGQMQSPIYIQLNGRTIAEAVTAEQLKRTRQAV